MSRAPPPTLTGGRSPRTEVEATQAQNALRDRLGLPQRDHYGDVPLPGDCQPPTRRSVAKGASCGDTNGDPHLLTYDNKRYDFQAVGEFVCPGKALVGTRSKCASNRRPALATWLSTPRSRCGSAAKGRGAMGADGLVLLVDGQARKLEDTTISGGRVDLDGRILVVAWENKGPKVFVRPIGLWGLHVALQPALLRRASWRDC